MAPVPRRWPIAAAGVVMQIALGSVYAWSVFRIPLTEAFGWTIPEVTLTFTIAIFVLGFAAFAGGVWMLRVGPRTVAIASGVLYGLGVLLAGLSDGRLWWMYGSYGLMGGVGLGLGYIVPVATLVRWFPDRRGMIISQAAPVAEEITGVGAAVAAGLVGAENVGSIYGLMLTAWSCAGVLGPMLIAALRQQTGQYGDALFVIAALMFAATIIPVLLGRSGRPAPVMAIPAKTA